MVYLDELLVSKIVSYLPPRMSHKAAYGLGRWPRDVCIPNWTKSAILSGDAYRSSPAVIDKLYRAFRLNVFDHRDVQRHNVGVLQVAIVDVISRMPEVDAVELMLSWGEMATCDRFIRKKVVGMMHGTRTEIHQKLWTFYRTAKSRKLNHYRISDIIDMVDRGYLEYLDKVR